MKLIFPILLDIGKSSKPIGDMMDSINDNMSRFGFSEKLSVVSQLGTITIDLIGTPDDETLEQCRIEAEKQLRQTNPDISIGKPIIKGD